VQVRIEAGKAFEATGDEFSKPHFVCASGVHIRDGVDVRVLGLGYHRAATAEEAEAKARASAQATLEALRAAVEVAQ
jgi:hypothetical protein